MLLISVLDRLDGCLLFQKGVLKVGGHQLRLRSGMPDLKKGVAGLKATDLDGATAIPACSVLIRLLPHVKVSRLIIKEQAAKSPSGLHKRII